MAHQHAHRAQAAVRHADRGQASTSSIGAADVPVDPPPDWNPKGLLAKAEAGADFVQTQFCMDIGVVRRYAARLRELGFKLPILIGVAPIPSAHSARWMREKLFGTIDPRRDRRAPGEGRRPEGRRARRICVELLQELAEIPGVAGAHVMAPMNFAEIPAAIEESGVLKQEAQGGVTFTRHLRRGRRLQDAPAARRQGRAAALPARRERRAGDHALHGEARAALRRAGARASRARASRTSRSGSRTSTTSRISIWIF